MKSYFSTIALLALVATLTGCSSKPAVLVEDPRAYLLESLLSMEHNAWWNPYRITDEAFISDFLDERIAKEVKWTEGIPNDDKSLDRFLWRIGGGLASAHTATPENRARVLEKIKQRYANPQIKIARREESHPGFAIVDYGYIPGEWVRARGGWSFRSEGTKSYDLAPADIIRGFQLAHEAFPEASHYLVRATIFFGGSRHKSEYQYGKGGGSLYYVHDLNRYYSKDSYPLEKVLSGEIDPSEVKMEGVGQESTDSPLILNMRPLEDPHGYHMDYAQD